MLRFFWLGLSLCAALLVPSSLPNLFRPVDYTLNDWRVRFALQPRPESRIVIVDVDERSLAELGAWPWPRDTIARLLKILIDDYRVSSVAVDMVFPEQRPHDDILAAQLRRPQMTGAIVFDLEQRNLPALPLALPSPPLLQQVATDVPKVFGIPAVANHAALLSAHIGHITPIFDVDGAVRRLPPLVCSTRMDCHPSLTLASYAAMAEKTRFSLQAGHGLLSPAWNLQVQAGDGMLLATLPMTKEGVLVVPYRHIRQDWISVSAVDILKHKAELSLFKGVMVLMGATALGLSDVITTPVSPVAAGLEPHAELLSSLLDNDFPFVPQWGLVLDAMLLAPFAALLAWALSRHYAPMQRAIVFPAWMLMTWMSTAALCVMALRLANLLLPLTPILLFPPLALLLTLLAEFYRTGRERAGVFTLLAAYLPRQVATRLTAVGHSVKVDTTVDAERRDITVIFADIHGFVGLIENQSPEIVARLMQRVFSEMAEAVVAHHGTIDKFIGDAIMAFWNAPDDDADHARHALTAACDMLRRMEALVPFCEELGVAPIHLGIGIETGTALVGNFGPVHRRTFTAFGEVVVLASRLEGMTKMYQQAVLVGENCAATLGLQGLRALGPARIRGRVQPLMLYVPD